MKLYEEFKLYENMWKAEVNTLTEGITTHFCNSCKQTVQLDDNAMCPNCADGISYLTDLVTEVLSEDSKLYIIYNTDKESINKADLNLATGHINKGAKVVQVTKEFFSQLKPVIHGETPEDSGCGKVVLNDEPKIIQLILAELEHYTSILENDLGKSAKQAKPSTSNNSNNQVPGQQKMDLGEEFKLYETMWDTKIALTENTHHFYSANNTVQSYIDSVGPYEGGYTLIKNFWLPTNRGKLNVGLISLDSTDGEDGLVCIPSYDVQFVASIEEANEVYEMLYKADAFDDIDVFIDRFVECSSADSVQELLDSNVGYLTQTQ